MIDTLTIGGLRGFGKKQKIAFAKPDHQNAGSGLTFIVGANNTGKTTIIEAIRSFNCDENNVPSFSPEKRNSHYNGGMICLKIQTETDCYTIKTNRKESGLAKAERTGAESNWKSLDTFVLNSRRSAEHEFNRNQFDKSTYLKLQVINKEMRAQSLSEFGSRLFAMEEHRETIDPMLTRFFGDDLKWGIDVTNAGHYYLNIITHNMHHSSEGMGDGIWNIFTICDALRDLDQDETVVIDEPELSLHPTYQKKLLKLFVEKAKDRQIIICTHSPFLIDFESISNGARLYRTKKDRSGNIKVHSLSAESAKYFKSGSKNLSNPHLCGIEAKELFFLEDRIIVVEGQDDVVYYNKAANDLHIDLKGTFYGWGAGGAGNIHKVLNMLSELGYEKVVAIFDKNVSTEKEDAEQSFKKKNYYILDIPTDDIRDKTEKHIEGLMTEHGEIKEEYKDAFQSLFSSINNYFGD